MIPFIVGTIAAVAAVAFIDYSLQVTPNTARTLAQQEADKANLDKRKAQEEAAKATQDTQNAQPKVDVGNGVQGVPIYLGGGNYVVNEAGQVFTVDGKPFATRFMPRAEWGLDGLNPLYKGVDQATGRNGYFLYEGNAAGTLRGVVSLDGTTFTAEGGTASNATAPVSYVSR